jgi:hypothetical protein
MTAENYVAIREQAEEVGWELTAKDFTLAVPERNGYHPIRAFSLPELFYRIVDTGANLPRMVADNEWPGLVSPGIGHEVQMMIRSFQPA